MFPRGGCSWQNTRSGPRFASIWMSGFCFACLVKTEDSRIIQRTNCLSRRAFYNETAVYAVYELFKQSIFYGKKKKTLHPKALISFLRRLRHKKYSCAAGGSEGKRGVNIFVLGNDLWKRGGGHQSCVRFLSGFRGTVCVKSGVLSLSCYSIAAKKKKRTENKRAYLVQKIKRSIFSH